MCDGLLLLTVTRSSVQEKKGKKPWTPRRKTSVFVSGARDLPLGLSLVLAPGMREHHLGTGRLKRREEPGPALRNEAQGTAPGTPSPASLVTGSEQQSRCLRGRPAAPDICPAGGEHVSTESEEESLEGGADE